MKVFCLFLLLLVSMQISAQRLYNSTKKISNQSGTFMASWGYNRSFYSKSDMQFKTAEYDFTLGKVQASDEQTKNALDYLSAKTAFKTQFNFKAAYYYMNRYALSLGLDNQNYVMDDGNRVILNGKIDTNLNAVWTGEYKNKEVITNRNDFHFQNKGINTLRVELIRTDKLYQSRNKYFALSSSFGLGIAAVFTKSTLNFAQTTQGIRSLSGVNFSGFGAMRLEFFRQVFFQAQLSGGSINAPKMQLDSNTDGFVKQQFWYGQRSFTVGFFHYFKPGNNCNDCPAW